MPKFIPATLELNEYVGTTGQTITIDVSEDSFPANTETISINSVSVSEELSDLVLSFSDNTFTFSSHLNDIFERTIKYLVEDENLQKKYYSANGFNYISSGYTGVYQYVPPTEQFKDIIFTINYTGSISGEQTISWTLTVRYNSDYSNLKFRELVLFGKGYENAITLYPELTY